MSVALATMTLAPSVNEIFSTVQPVPLTIAGCPLTVTLPTPDGAPLRLVFLILTPLETPTMQLKVLQRIASLITNETLRRKILRAKTDDSLLNILRTADTLLAT